MKREEDERRRRQTGRWSGLVRLGRGRCVKGTCERERGGGGTAISPSASWHIQLPGDVLEHLPPQRRQGNAKIRPGRREGMLTCQQLSFPPDLSKPDERKYGCDVTECGWTSRNIGLFRCSMTCSLGEVAYNALMRGGWWQRLLLPNVWNWETWALCCPGECAETQRNVAFQTWSAKQAEENLKRDATQ